MVWLATSVISMAGAGGNKKGGRLFQVKMGRLLALIRALSPNSPIPEGCFETRAPFLEVKKLVEPFLV